MTAADAACAAAAQTGRAARGLARLARLDPHWSDGFDFSAGGFVRSFVARLLGLPFYLFSAANLNTGLEAIHAGAPSPLWSEAVAFLLDSAAYPVLIALLARPLGATRGYAGFIVTINWVSLFLNLLLGAISLLALGGEAGVGAFGLAWITLAAVAVYLTWRAAHETLTDELAPIVLVVLLSVAVSVIAGQLAGSLAGGG